LQIARLQLEAKRTTYVDKRIDELEDALAIAQSNTDAAIDDYNKVLAENARLRKALVEEREENLWNAYNEGHERDGEWTHMFMSDGEWLARECGFDPTKGYYPAEEIKAAIPKIARAALQEADDG